MSINLLANVAAAGRRVGLLAAAAIIVSFSATASVPARAHSAQDQQDKQAAQDKKQQEKTEKQEQKDIKKVVKKAHRPRGDARQIMRYERAHFKKYDLHAGERLVREPDEQFRQHFGAENLFQMARPTVAEGFPRFEYHGFSFVVEEPWPEYWYDDDNFYVVFERGGYYLRDYDDPGVEVQVVLVKSTF